MNDVDRLVEQARDEWDNEDIELETRELLAGLADAVEQLQDDRGWVGQLNTALADAHKSAVKERDEARARVAALEAAIDDLVNGPYYPEDVLLERLRALLVPSTGQETT